MSWPKIDVILNAIKNSNAQTITDLKPTIDGIKTNFDEWKLPWTAERAGKIDKLDVQVSTRSTQTSVDELTLNIGETADTGGGVSEGTAMAKLNTLLGRGGVKRIIRGYIAWNHTGWAEKGLNPSSSSDTAFQIYTQVTIPTVDISKSMVLCDIIGNTRSIHGPAGVAFLSNATTLEIRLTGKIMSESQSLHREVNYQIIEFY